MTTGSGTGTGTGQEKEKLLNNFTITQMTKKINKEKGREEKKARELQLHFEMSHMSKFTTKHECPGPHQ